MDVRLVELEISEEQRMRRVVSRSNYRVTGKYPSWKKQRMAYWESSIELDGFRRLDADPSVFGYQEQPAKITYEVDGKRHVHYPDILIDQAGRRVFREVKTDDDAASSEVVTRTEVMKMLLAPRGFGYRVWPESEIRKQPQLDNEIYLLQYGRSATCVFTLERLRRLFELEPIISWDTLVHTVLTPQGLFPACRLVLEGCLLIDHDLPLSPQTAVRFNFAKGNQA